MMKMKTYYRVERKAPDGDWPGQWVEYRRGAYSIPEYAQAEANLQQANHPTHEVRVVTFEAPFHY
jgi:hypothetical protein